MGLLVSSLLIMWNLFLQNSYSSSSIANSKNYCSIFIVLVRLNLHIFFSFIYKFSVRSLSNIYYAVSCSDDFNNH